MKISYLGQQSWMIQEGDTTLLVDPVLSESFGHNPSSRFSIYPPRMPICLKDLPPLSGIILTNEHLDHFHYSTLRQLEPSIPVYLGKYTPYFVSQVIEKRGGCVVLCENGEPYKIGHLCIKFFIGSSKTPFWERRVYHPYIESLLDIEARVLIQSDTLLNPRFLEKIAQCKELSPTCLIATNNSQITRKDQWSAHDNLYPIGNSLKNDPSAGLKILREVLVEYSKGLPDLQYTLFSGGSYTLNNEEATPFKYSDYRFLGKIGTSLSIGQKLIGLRPGESLEYITGIINKEPFVILDDKRLKVLEKNFQKSSIAVPPTLSKAIVGKYETLQEIQEDLCLVEKELSFMAKMLTVSNLGKHLLQVNDFFQGHLGPERFAVHYRVKSEYSTLYVFDLNQVCFKRLEDSPHLDELLEIYPFGIDLFLKDFVAILKGELQIWELATANMRQWYLGDVSFAPTIFLYSYFSEQIRPELAEKLCFANEA